MISSIISFATALFLACTPPTDPEPTAPKHEFRAVWVASFHNIDWPSAKGLEPKQQRKEYLSILEQQQTNGMNAVVVQIRPCGDAFYPSQLVPWSEYLSGTQGQAPEPFYDPLAFMVQATHDRNMEFHAWFNPFRAVSHDRFSSVIDSNIVHQRPEWVLHNGSQLYLDPGIPEVRAYVIQTILEVVNNYDVDGIHFDDYFYPYRDADEPYDDGETFAQYGSDFTSVHDWRRNNIDQFIEQLSDSIRSHKAHVKFGVSPVGIWRNQKDDPRGSNSQVGYTAYDLLYADVRKWTEKGWLDYVAPQLYWAASNPRARYDQLLPWWASNSFGRHLYIGQAAYKVKEGHSRQWRDPNHLPMQLRMNQQFPEIKGSIFYSARSFQGNPLNLEGRLRQEHYRYPSLVPAMTWKDSIPPLEPRQLRAVRQGSRVQINWQAPTAAADGDQAAYYVLYRVSAKQRPDLSNPANILTVTRKPYWVDPDPMPQEGFLYLLTSVDRLHNESETCAAVLVQGGSPSKRIGR